MKEVRECSNENRNRSENVNDRASRIFTDAKGKRERLNAEEMDNLRCAFEVCRGDRERNTEISVPQM